MTDALDRLIDAVELGDDTAHHHASAFPSESAYGKCTWHDSHKASSGSLDAAKALHEALLPERAVAELRYSKRYSDESYVYINMPSGGVCQGRSTNPARAWLLAILKAYRSQINKA